MIIDGVMLLWFGLTALSVLFVTIDIRNTPESVVMKWGFVLFTLYAGPFGAFLYVLGCREPLPGMHEQYVSVRWRQVLGSTMHCVAGDGIGILVGAVIGSVIMLPMIADLALEYVLGFGFGWTIFQALFMRDMAGGDYGKSLRMTFMAEFLSMNCLMGGMIVVSMLAWKDVAAAHDPLQPLFWFRMSVALMIGFVAAYPMNWWLVAHHLKHGMTTVRPASAPAGPMANMAGMKMDEGSGSGGMKMAGMDMASMKPSAPHPPVPVMALVSVAVLAAGLLIAWAFGGLSG
ncbi:MAG: DUF4396 domain-containing protein [Bauldia sp.]|nr:DUF4396 domain-containing protein [Bauldia sp.]